MGINNRKKIILVFLIALAVLITPAIAEDDSDAEDETDINVDVRESCELSVVQYNLPNDGVIGIGRTGNLYTMIRNTGSFEAEIDNGANFSVSRENVTTGEIEYLDLDLQQDLYEEYEPLVDYQNYSANLSTSGDESYAEYNKIFTAAVNYDTGTYNATTSFNATCDRGPGRESLDAHVNVTEDLSIVESEEDSVDEEPEEIGEATTDEAITENFTIDAPIEVEVNESLNFSVDGPIEIDEAQNFSFQAPVEINDTIEFSLDAPVQKNESFEFTRDAPIQANETLEFSLDAPVEVEDTVVGEAEDARVPGDSIANVINIEPKNRTNTVERGRVNPVEFEIQNVGDRSVPDISLLSDLRNLPEGWEASEADVTNLEPGEEVNRSISFEPPEDAELGREIVPIEAYSQGNTRVDLDYAYLDVIRAELNATIDIAEAPPAVNVPEETERNIPILVENTGEVPLNNIDLLPENIEECADYETETIETLEVNQTQQLQFTLQTESSQECQTQLNIQTDEDANAYREIDITITPEDVLIPERQAPPLLAIIWTGILALYALIRKKLEWESITSEIPLILLIVGESVLIIYLAVNTFGLIDAPFLPF